MHHQNKNAVYRIWLCIFIAGIFFGTFMMNLGSNMFLGDEGIFNIASLNRMKYLEVDSKNFFPYVLKQRIKPILFLGLISTTSLGVAAAYFCIAWQGILTGMLVTAAVIRYGIKGMLLILAGLFPQQLLLIPAGIMMLCWCYENCCFRYYPSRCMWLAYGNKSRQYLHQGMLLIWIICVVVIGCILECYVNPILMTDIVKIF